MVEQLQKPRQNWGDNLCNFPKPNSLTDWSPVWRWERSLVWTSLSALITISITFHVNNWGQQYECLSGEAVWKCVAFLTYLNNDHILHLSIVANYSLHLPVWWFGTARNLFYEIVVFMHTSNLNDKVSNLDIWEEFRVIPLHWKQFVEMVWTFDWDFFQDVSLEVFSCMSILRDLNPLQTWNT